MAKKPRDPFELSLNVEQRKQLALFLCDQLQAGLDARAANDQEVDYWWSLYEQARTRVGRNQPWPDAADLTSYLASEKVDALQARIMRTVWQEPLVTVEGWGQAANKAPFVEEFHQWKAEEERLQSVIDKLVLQALVEPRGLLEVSEGTELRTSRSRITAKVETDPLTGGIVYNEDMQPKPVLKPDGTFQEATAQEIGAEMVVDTTDKIRTGPVYRLLPYRDSVILPGHARDKEDIWGYGKRFWRQYADLKRKAAAGLYDQDAVDRIDHNTDREPDAALSRSGQTVAPQDNPALAEKELWELLILIDLNAFFESRDLPTLPKQSFPGARWFLTTLHLPTQQLLRVQHDDLERSRFVPVILFPRIDRATEGFSFVGHKLITTIEEHTAWRNMAADRAAMVVQAPVKRLTGALWDPEEQPWGPKAVIDVRSMDELQPVEVPDFTAPVLEHIRMMEQTAERLAGINDIASGQVTAESKTLGEVQMATEQSFVRMDLIVKRFQEALEDIAQIRHAIWKRVLAERQDGMDAPSTVLSSLEGRGVNIDEYLPDKKITADLLEGAFRFKPNGSVETANPSKRRADWLQFMQIIPTLPPMPGQNPLLMARVLWNETLRMFNVENRQAFIGSPQQDLQQTAMAQLAPMLAQAMGGPMGPPAMAGPMTLPPGPPAPMPPPTGDVPTP